MERRPAERLSLWRRRPRDRPLFGSPKIKRFLEQQYREKHLGEYCTTRFCQTSDDAEWEQMVGANFVRGIYIFVAETSEQQDLKFISEFNSLPNVNHFNGVTRNCADFTRRVINSYFPHAVSPDYINDFGMTSPKAVARSFTHYALRHPEMHFRVLHYAQLPGTIKRSERSAQRHRAVVPLQARAADVALRRTHAAGNGGFLRVHGPLQS